MSWHADDVLVDRYLGGALDIGTAASLEAHLLHCDLCRATLTARVPATVRTRVDRAWTGVRERIEVPPLPLVVRAMQRLGLSDQSAVLLAAARSMSTPWTVATAIVLVFAAIAVPLSGPAGISIYLTVAPLVPVAGVVGAFGPAGDPLTEVTAATPYSPARLVLLRSLGVVATGVPLAVLVGLLAPGSPVLAFAWLAPALAFILLTLLASTWFEPLAAGGAIAIGWSLLVGAASRAHVPSLPVDGPAQFVYLALAALAAIALALRIARSTSPGGIA